MGRRGRKPLALIEAIARRVRGGDLLALVASRRAFGVQGLSCAEGALVAVARELAWPAAVGGQSGDGLRPGW